MAAPVQWVCMKCGAAGEAVADYGDDAATVAAMSHTSTNHACADEWGPDHIYFAQLAPYPD